MVDAVSSELVTRIYCCMSADCSKTYNSKSNLKRHVEACHWGLKPYECEVCHLSFASRQTCVEHSDLHYGKKPYTCRICGERFRQASRFSLHKRTHIEENDYSAASEEEVTDKRSRKGAEDQF